MRTLYVTGTGVMLPPAVPVSAAIDDGRYPAKLAQRAEQLAVTVPQEGDRAVDYAVGAAFQALLLGRHEPADIALLTYSPVLPEIPVWSPTSYVQDQLGIGRHCAAIEIRQGCNGMLAALTLAGGYLDGLGHGRHAALLTAADIWQLPTVDPWTYDPSLPAGAGGAAVLISTREGWAKVRSIATDSDPGLEAAHRGDEEFGQTTRPVDFRQRVHEWAAADLPFGLTEGAATALMARRTDELWQRHASVVTGCVTSALQQANVSIDDISRVVLPHLGAETLRQHYLGPIGVSEERTTWPTGSGRSIGHMGAADPIAALHDLRESGGTSPGDLLLMYADGVGITASAAVLEVLR
jgi:3-oxoacyl-[acyl-carrier-protein] synthase III